MAFLSGSLSFERFRVLTPEVRVFSPEHLERMAENAAGEVRASADDPIRSGFLAGDHLFDLNFELEKNALLDALHFGIRVDTHRVPSAILRAWTQMELNALLAEHPGRRPTKAQREQAKEAVEQRARVESTGGKFIRTQHFPALWDAPSGMVYCGGARGAAADEFVRLMNEAFEMELDRVGAGYLADRWAQANGAENALDEARPSVFHPEHTGCPAGWANPESPHPDFLGNEFLLWLWYTVDQETDTFALADGTEVAIMFARSLSLECPAGISGRQTLSFENPTRLPEALEAVRTGKLPRKAGLTMARSGQQYDLTLQAESLAISGAKLTKDPDAEGRAMLESRIDAIRQLNDTLDRLYEHFLGIRLAATWEEQVEKISRWASPLHPERRRNAA